MAKGIDLFRYEPPAGTTGKTHVRLPGTEFFKADVQKVGKGGETNLHSHSGNDGFWFVLAGRARFYGEAEEPIAELGPNEGAVVHHGTPYWFEAVGDEPLEILHIATRTNAKQDKRIDFTARPRRAVQGDPDA